MGEIPDHTVRIVKCDDEQYHFVLRDGFRHIDEKVNGVQLLGMLSREIVVNARGEVVEAQEILYRLDTDSVGQEILIGIKERMA